VYAGGSFFASGKPKRIPRKGADNARSTPSPAIAVVHGRRWMKRLQRYQNVVS
jgi:hypothetical protein